MTIDPITLLIVVLLIILILGGVGWRRW